MLMMSQKIYRFVLRWREVKFKFQVLRNRQHFAHAEEKINYRCACIHFIRPKPNFECLSSALAPLPYFVHRQEGCIDLLI